MSEAPRLARVKEEGRMVRIVLPTVLAAVALVGCARQRDVRAACTTHHGVAAVNGNSFRKYVTCRDGFYKAVR